MTHRIVVNVETGVTSIVEYTPEEQAAHDAAVAQAEQQALIETQAEQPQEITNDSQT
jgi:hypothetical protein